MNKPRWSFVVIALAFALTPLIRVRAQAPVINLAEGTINGRPLCGLSVDNVTDMIGRPSAVDDNEVVAPITGLRLLYHPLGLAFQFRPESSESEGSWVVTIHLSREWDDSFNEFFLPFPGEIVGGVSADWKDEDVKEVFSNYAITVRTAEEHRRSLEEVGVYRQGTTLNHVVRVDFGLYSGNFQHERNTRFLERVTVQCKKE